MTKDDRLSFRIPTELSDLIDLAVESFDIKDHSEFGIQAVKCYLTHLTTTKTEMILIAEAIAALLDIVGSQETPAHMYFANYYTSGLPPMDFDPELIISELSSSEPQDAFSIMDREILAESIS